MKIDRGRKITLTYRENGGTGKATLIVDVSADEGELPHEHRDDLKDVAAELLGVPLDSLEDVEVELKRTGGDHTHPHPHPVVLPSSDESSPEKAKA